MVDQPFAVAPLLVVAAAHERQRLPPSSVWQPGWRSSPECRSRVGELDADLDATDLVDEPLEAVEVDLDVVVDRDPERLGDRRCQLLRAVVVRRC